MEKYRSASVPHIKLEVSRNPAPHIKFEVPRKPFPHFSIHTRVTQWGWKHSGKFALFFSALICVSILIPYSVDLASGHVKPLLPLISHSGADPTSTGLSNAALYFTAVIGAVMVTVRYIFVSSQNETKNWKLNILNKLGLASGYVSFAGLVVVASFPETMHQDQSQLLQSSVSFPHMMGAFFAFFFGAMYLLFQTTISIFFYEGNGRTVCFRFAVFLACSVCFVVSSLSTANVKVSSNSTDIYLQSGIATQPAEDSFLLGSISEWFLVFFFAVYFLSFVKESEKVSVSITFRHLMTGRRISIASLTSMSKI